MQRVVLIVPGLIGEVEDASMVRGLPGFNRLAERGQVFRLAAMPPGAMVEAAMLGLDPVRLHMEQGPLTVAALGWDPPQRSVHAHLSLLSVTEGIAQPIPGRMPNEVVDEVFKLACRLHTKRLTTLKGEGTDHGLVIEEGSLDMGWTSAADVSGQRYRERLPEGDDERLLRQFIDDSINLLSEQEFNRIREEEGLPPANLLWPWGFGWRAEVPNLGFRTGEIGWVQSASIRLQGLTRLAHWKHGERTSVGSGTAVPFESIRGAMALHPLSIVFLESFATFRAEGKEEELAWLAHEMDQRLIQPLAEKLAEPFFRLAILCPTATGGLGVMAESGPNPEAGRFPFDERVLEEPSLARRDLDEAVREAMRRWNEGIG